MRPKDEPVKRLGSLGEGVIHQLIDGVLTVPGVRLGRQHVYVPYPLKDTKQPDAPYPIKTYNTQCTIPTETYTICHTHGLRHTELNTLPHPLKHI